MRTCFPSRPRQRSARWLAVTACTAAAAAACARVEPPPGGPVDDRPARLVAAQPGSLAVKVSPADPLRLTFDEKVTRSGFAKAVEVVPGRTFRKVDFDGLNVVLWPHQPWPADTVVVWTLLPTLKDRHGVALGRPLGGAFTTGDSIPGGAIVGGVAGEGVRPARVRVALTLPPPEGAKRGMRWRLVGAQEDGSFRIAPLDVPSGPFRLEAFEDMDGNGRRDPREATAAVDSLSLTRDRPILNMGLLELIDLEAPVEVWACLRPQPADSLRRRVGWRPLQGDQARATASLLDSTGCTPGVKLAPGQYEISFWLDLDADGRFGPDSTGVSEPFADPATWEVRSARPDTFALRPPDRTLPWAQIDTLSHLPVPRELLVGAPQ